MNRITARRLPFAVVAMALGALTLSACGDDTPADSAASASAAPVSVAPVSVAPARMEGTVLRVQDTVIAATFDASGVAEPAQQATLSTKLMGTVNAVLVREGETVRAGQPLIRIDARDLVAK
ncbi:MAG: biotin/lipoyl-binding protein, partial [Gemmatimonas sp.]